MVRAGRAVHRILRPTPETRDEHLHDTRALQGPCSGHDGSRRRKERLDCCHGKYPLPMVKAGKARALAVTTAKRKPFLPDTPTMMEVGVPAYEVST